MNRIQKAFEKGKIFIPFVTAGDPSLAVTEKLVLGMAQAGAGIIEIGIPFSDPVAEGVVIQRADERALKGGVTTDKIFEMVSRIREKTEVPLAFMTYINPIFTYGTDHFLEKCKKTGVDAVIIPDLPFEEKGEVLDACHANGICLISLIAPSSKERIRMITEEAEGFVYCVSSMGVTGVRAEIKTDIRQMVRLVKETKDIPCAIGFGIGTPDKAREMASVSDGAIVGSAIVKLCEKYGENCIEPVLSFTKEMVEAVRQA